MDNRYTPTTDEVRGAWVALTQAPASFDRWLIAERQRVASLAKLRMIDEELGAYEAEYTPKEGDIMMDEWIIPADGTPPFRQGEAE